LLNSREKGKRGEDRAVEFLKNKGYSIVERNFYSKFGEIDIIAEREGVYHFVEVKSGTSFEPIYNINHSKLNKIVKTMRFYLQKFKIESPYQIDAIIIKDEVQFIKNITMF